MQAHLYKITAFSVNNHKLSAFFVKRYPTLAKNDKIRYTFCITFNSYGFKMLDQIQADVKTDILTVTQHIKSSTQSSIDLVNQIGSYALQQPGRKLIRPTILILMARALKLPGEEHIILATIIELIHSATLLHDDVIDHAHTRRNKKTTHKVFGGTQSILMGDFIYASAFQLIAKLKNPEITDILAQATKEIVEGEILQLSLQQNINTTLDDYMRIIHAKTAMLFSTGTKCIARLNKHSDENKLYSYGYHFGMLYQITDDILDINTHNTELNKAHGTDLKEGKMTLPTLLAYASANPSQKKIIEDVIAGNECWTNMIPVLEETNAISSCQPYIEHHLKLGLKSLEILPDSIEKQHLENLLRYTPSRKK